jgi:predicted enzyme related to lactoylglutathione lyase
MTEASKPSVGSISWVDLTVPDATSVREFYRSVVGWEPTPVDMGGYSDFCMNEPGSGRTAAGVCHARGPNADLPAQWLVYITVANLAQSLAECRRLGGAVLREPTSLGDHGTYGVIRDPAGAVAALVEPPAI